MLESQCGRLFRVSSGSCEVGWLLITALTFESFVFFPVHLYMLYHTGSDRLSSVTASHWLFFACVVCRSYSDFGQMKHKELFESNENM